MCHSECVMPPYIEQGLVPTFKVFSLLFSKKKGESSWNGLQIPINPCLQACSLKDATKKERDWEGGGKKETRAVLSCRTLEMATWNGEHSRREEKLNVADGSAQLTERF